MLRLESKWQAYSSTILYGAELPGNKRQHFTQNARNKIAKLTLNIFHVRFSYQNQVLEYCTWFKHILFM